MATSVDHVGLSVGDLDRVSTFYCEVFGLTMAGPHTLADGSSRIALLTGAAGVRLELTELSGSHPTASLGVTEAAHRQGWFHWSLRVDDLGSALSRVAALGGDIVTAVATARTRPGIRFSYIADPEGNLVELTEAARTGEIPED